MDWVKDQIDKLRNKRTARGAYEETGSVEQYSGARRGRGLEDDAWDTRVGNEDPYGAGPGGYNEEQELGLAPTPGVQNEPYGGGQDYLRANTAYGDERGRSHSREQSSGSRLGDNPFADENAVPNLRSVSPRPEMDKGHTKGNLSVDTDNGGNTSPISTRKSIFREGI